MDKFRAKLHSKNFDLEKGPEGSESAKKTDTIYTPHNVNFGQKETEKQQNVADEYIKLFEDGTIDKVTGYNDEGILSLDLGNIEESERARVAEIILERNGKTDSIFLNGLIEMSDGIINAMKDKDIIDVYLGDCKIIQPRQIEQMGNLGIKNVELYGLDSLDYEQAKALGKFERVRLSDLITQEKLKPEILKELCNVKYLSLEGVRDLSSDQAECFKDSNIEELVLGLEKITEDQARCLSGIKILEITDVPNLSPEQIKIFSNGKVKKIRFNGYTKLLFDAMGEDDL